MRSIVHSSSQGQKKNAPAADDAFLPADKAKIG